MRSILIILILAGVVKAMSGTSTIAKINEEAGTAKALNYPTISAPRFTSLKGNLFLLIETKKDLDLEDGAIIEFDFGKKKIFKSFHVNDVNQNILDNSETDLLVMVHQDLALTLKTDRLIKLMINDGSQIHSFQIGQLWQPHVNLIDL